jgi:taurine dioxygenase
MTTTAPTTLKITPVSGQIGAAIEGVDLREVGPDQVGPLIDAIHEHGVVFFPGQDLTPADHLRFAKLLGTIRMPHALLDSMTDEGLPEIGVIASDQGGIYSDHWHSDVTWTETPCRYSILHMQVLPEAGGDTMWSSQYLAYETLSAPLRSMLTGLTARHEIGTGAGAVHPVVIQHPATGRKALFVNSYFTKRILELEQAESDALLPMLFANATRPEFTCRRRWVPGELAVWDNHFVQHYALHDYGAARRRIHRIEIEGEPPVPARS